MRILFVPLSLLLVCASLIAIAQDASPESRRVVGSAEAGASLIKKIAPDYPPLARQARIQGTVVLKAVIGKSGDVEDLQLISGHPMLAPAAMTAVRQWKYKPFVVNDEPVEVETTVQVNFTLADKPQPAQDSSHPPTAATPSRIRVSSGVLQGLLISKVEPTYPDDAREQRVQGVVVLKVEIDTDGNVAKIELISGHPLLAPAAIEAVRQWKYKPYLLNGAPVTVESQVQINFTLAAQ